MAKKYITVKQPGSMQKKLIITINISNKKMHKIGPKIFNSNKNLYGPKLDIIIGWDSHVVM